NPTEDLRLPITEWEQSLAFDTAAECETFIATRWVKAEKEHREFKLERYRCVPADAVYPPRKESITEPSAPPLSSARFQLSIYRTVLGIHHRPDPHPFFSRNSV